jgi:hypothetical protein
MDAVEHFEVAVERTGGFIERGYVFAETVDG